MKKIILTFAAVFAFGFANAQDKGGSSGMMKFGVKGGIQSTNLGGDLDADAKIGFYVGGLADFTVSEKFHVQPELLLSAEGADDDGGITYLRIPVMAKYYVMDGLNIQAGPEIAFKVGADDAIDDYVTGTDFGIGIGAGYEMPSGLMFDARYNGGLFNISDVDFVDINTTGFQIGVGYRF